MDNIKLLVELVGTFLFLYVILNVSNVKNGIKGFTTDPTLGALTIALTLLAVIFAFGAISGGNFNPAVSFAKYLDGTLDMTTAGGYMVAQLIGAVGAFYFFQMTRK